MNDDRIQQYWQAYLATRSTSNSGRWNLYEFNSTFGGNGSCRKHCGWEAVEKAIDRAFQQHDEVAVESLGAGDGFDRFHASLIGKYNVKRIKVYTDLTECLNIELLRVS